MDQEVLSLKSGKGFNHTTTCLEKSWLTFKLKAKI